MGETHLREGQGGPTARRQRGGRVGPVHRVLQGAAGLAVAVAVPMAVTVTARAATSVSPPASIADDCSVDVTAPMQHWLDGLPADTTVVAPAGACYLVDEGLRLADPQGLTLSGGVWRDDADLAAPSAGADNPVFWLVGGSDVTLSGLTIEGADPGGYYPSGAFAAGVRSDGVVGLTVSDVDVQDVFGDGIELNVLRGDRDSDGTIVTPTEQATISDVDVTGAGRQGISFVGVDGAQVDDVQLSDTGLDTFDVEADQWDEGAEDVTIDGCTSSGSGGVFFANEGNGGGGQWTGNITVEDCTMDAVQAGDPIYIRTPLWATTPRGPYVFSGDTIECGHSTSVSCVEVGGADVTITGSSLRFPAGTLHEPVYDVTDASTLDLVGDDIGGYGSLGTVDARSAVDTSAVAWSPFAAPVQVAHPQAAPAPSTVAANGPRARRVPAGSADATVAVRSPVVGQGGAAASGAPVADRVSGQGATAPSPLGTPGTAGGGRHHRRHDHRVRVRHRSGRTSHRAAGRHDNRRSATRS